MISAVDFTEAKINIVKFRADGERYFGFFNRHIPEGLGAETRILLYKIGNIAAIKRMVEKNPAAGYAVYDRECVCTLAKIACPGVRIAEFASDIQEKYDIFEDKDMKFDIIIMNPPFGKLYIKILAEVMKHIAESGKVVSLQPINKWQEARLFGLESPVAGSIVIDRFSAKDVNEVFGISSSVDNGIVSNVGSCCELFNNEQITVKIKHRINNAQLLISKLESTKNDKPYPVIFGIGIGTNCAIKTRYRLCSAFKNTAMRPGEIGHAKKYYAKNQREQELIWKFYQNPIMRFLVKEFGFGGVPVKIIPFALEFKDKSGNTPLDAEWPLFKLAKWFNLTKQDLEYIYKSLEENMYDYEKAEIEEAIAEYDKTLEDL